MIVIVLLAILYYFSLHLFPKIEAKDKYYEKYEYQLSKNGLYHVKKELKWYEKFLRFLISVYGFLSFVSLYLLITFGTKDLLGVIPSMIFSFVVMVGFVYAIVKRYEEIENKEYNRLKENYIQSQEEG